MWIRARRCFSVWFNVPFMTPGSVKAAYPAVDYNDACQCGFLMWCSAVFCSQVLMCASTFLVLFMGNFFTTLGVVYHKYTNQDKAKDLWSSQVSQSLHTVRENYLSVFFKLQSAVRVPVCFHLRFKGFLVRVSSVTLLWNSHKMIANASLNGEWLWSPAEKGYNLFS